MRLIDADKFEAFVIRTNGDEEFVNGVQYVLEKIDNAPTIEAIPKDQYEARLKADLVAMLTEIQLEIVELKSYESADGQDLVMLADIGTLFQQKINELKGEGDGKDN